MAEWKTRPSEYLLAKVNSLSEAVRFFSAEGKGDRARRVVFLAQIEFWDWEFENLLFSFENFSERADVWTADAPAIEDMLQKKGFILNIRQVRPLAKRVHVSKRVHEWRQQADGSWKCDFVGIRDKVEPPVGQLNVLVDRWNRLLDLCEKLLNLKKAKEIKSCCGVAVEGLGAYRKEHFVPPNSPSTQS
jgi:hypothetical protein